MDKLAIPTLLPLATGCATGSGQEKGKIQDAAQQFEALLITELLRSAREAGGCFRSDQDSASDCATGFAEQQLSIELAKRGGLGLAGLVASGLEPKKTG